MYKFNFNSCGVILRSGLNYAISTNRFTIEEYPPGKEGKRKAIPVTGRESP
jgi:hypothetical protein